MGMTIDKAKSVINELKLYVEDLHSYSADEVAEALDMAIQVLEQQPCEDCISRQAVKEMLREEWTKYIPMELDINLSYVLEKISELPSVTPQPKTAHWNRVIDKAGYWVWECDKCGWQQRFNTNYCPDCGAKMEVEE